MVLRVRPSVQLGQAPRIVKMSKGKMSGGQINSLKSGEECSEAKGSGKEFSEF